MASDVATQSPKGPVQQQPTTAGNQQQQQQRQEQSPLPPPVWHGLVAGAASGLASRIVTYPADTIKARLQVQGAAATAAAARFGDAGRAAATHYSSTLHAARDMLVREGPPSLYRGFGAILIGVLPANVAYFGGYELGKRIVPQDWGIGADMATGAIAQLLAGVVYTPIDIIKERMQVQAIMGGAYSYRGPLHAFRSLLTEGGRHADGGSPGSGRGGGGGEHPSNSSSVNTTSSSSSSSATHRVGRFSAVEGSGHARNSTSCNSTRSSSRLHSSSTITSSSSNSSSGGGSSSGGNSSSGGGGTSNRAPAHKAARHGTPKWRLSGLFRGYWATNCVWLPWNVIYISAYEGARGAAARAQGLQRPEQLPAWSVAACSAGAAAAAAVLTHPGDVVKTRLQVLTATEEGRGLTAVAVARQMWAVEGGRAFWSGLGARLLNIAPGCALSWALYEQMKAYLASNC